MPTFLALGGDAGCGKSHLGRQLAKSLGLVLLDQDTMTNPIASLVLERSSSRSFDDPHIREALRRARYDSLAAVARENLQAGNSVLAVAPFSAERTEPRAWQETIAALDCPQCTARLLWMNTPASVARERMAARGLSRDAQKIADFDTWASGRFAPPITPHIEVPWDRPVEDAIALLSNLPGMEDMAVETARRA